MKTFFFFFFFWRPDFGRKKPLNFGFRRKNQTQFRWRPFFFLFFFLFLETTWFWAEKTFEFRISAEKPDSISVKTFFFGDLILGGKFWILGHQILGGKNLWIPELSEKFRLNFRTNRVKLIQEQWKFGSRSLHFSHSFKIAPPPFPNPSYAPACEWLLQFDFFGGVCGDIAQTNLKWILRRVSDLRDLRKKKGKMSILAAKSRPCKARQGD